MILPLLHQAGIYYFKTEKCKDDRRTGGDTNPGEQDQAKVISHLFLVSPETAFSDPTAYIMASGSVC